jgi:radical SAM superfamily enzyme YgiQ (UPF0313 family)
MYDIKVETDDDMEIVKNIALYYKKLVKNTHFYEHVVTMINLNLYLIKNKNFVLKNNLLKEKMKVLNEDMLKEPDILNIYIGLRERYKNSIEELNNLT